MVLNPLVLIRRFSLVTRTIIITVLGLVMLGAFVFFVSLSMRAYLSQHEKGELMAQASWLASRIDQHLEHDFWMMQIAAPGLASELDKLKEN